MAITNEGESQSFSYTGGMQTFTAPQKGVYKLEVWGAKGGGDGGGKGGYAYGHALLEKGAVLYICCGQAGAKASTATTYNGGGGGARQYFDFTPSYKPTGIGCSGGGATHIATRFGTLAQMGSTSGLLLVAGGGGGCGEKTASRYGGTGGGSSGGTGTSSGGFSNAGGTQSSGYAFGQGQTSTAYWGDYSGDSNYAYAVGNGAGGGLYGGYAADIPNYGHQDAARSGAGGGSGYTGGVPMLTYFGTYYRSGMSNGQHSGAGSAKITLVKKGELPVVFNGTTLQKIIFNGVEVGSLIYNGTKLFMERIRGWRKRGISVFRNDDRRPAW